MSTAQENKLKNLPVYNTNRVSDKLPRNRIAPFNFGIDKDWWEAVGQHMREDPETAHLVEQFFGYEDPAGFGSNKVLPC